jgi:hypothetical protein
VANKLSHRQTTLQGFTQRFSLSRVQELIRKVTLARQDPRRRVAVARLAGKLSLADHTQTVLEKGNLVGASMNGKTAGVPKGHCSYLVAQSTIQTCGGVPLADILLNERDVEVYDLTKSVQIRVVSQAGQVF